jgi:hypothetical protein
LGKIENGKKNEKCGGKMRGGHETQGLGLRVILNPL